MTFTKQELLEIENFDYAGAVSCNDQLMIEEVNYNAKSKKKTLSRRAKKELKNLSIGLQKHGFARMEQMMMEERGDISDYNELMNR